MPTNKAKNEKIDTEKIRTLAEQKFKSLSKFGEQVLGFTDREAISTRLSDKRKITADELVTIADGLGVTVDDLRISSSE